MAFASQLEVSVNNSGHGQQEAQLCQQTAGETN